MKTIDLRQGSQAWLAWRQKRVTATDMAVLMGATTDKSRWRLWKEKKGQIAPQNLAANPYVRRGKRLEDTARQAVEEKIGLPIMPICVEDDNELLGASLDGIVTLDGKRTNIEIKILSENNHDDVVEKGRDSEFVRKYLVQVQHQCAVVKTEAAKLCFYSPADGKAGRQADLQIFDIEPDELLHEEMHIEARLFKDSLDDGTEPEKDPEQDQFSPEGEDLERWQERATRYRQAHAEVKEADKQLKAKKEITKNIEAEFIEDLGEFVSGEAAGVQVTHYWTNGQVDARKALEDVREYLTTRIRQAENFEAKEELMGALEMVDDNALEEYRKPGRESVKVTLKK